MTESARNGKGWLGHLVQFVGVMAVIITAALWIQKSLHSIDIRLIALESSVSDRWTRTDMKVWAQDLKLQNGELEIPHVPRNLLYKDHGR